MFTVCSKCNLRLTVTATDLRAAQGYVRCGRCHNVFNALAALADDPARQAVPASTADTQQRPVLTQPEPPHPEPPDPEPPNDTALEFNPASTNINEVFIEAMPGSGTGSFESIVLMGDDDGPPPAAADPGPVAAPEAPLAPVQRLRAALADLEATDTHEILDPRKAPAAHLQLAEEPAPPAPLDVAPPLRESAPLPVPVPVPEISVPEREAQTALVDWSVAAEIASAIDEPPEASLLKRPAAMSNVPAWVLYAGACMLGLGLVAQLAHHYRAELAAVPLLHAPMVAVYEALDLPLAPEWNITDYVIRQLGATTDGAGTGDLVVRASISNNATHVQPLPMLRVVLQDRFGNRLAGRDLQPAEYLATDAPQVSLMPAGQRVDVQVAFRDPGQAATGFEVDACMAGSDHAVTCANDPGNH